MIHIHISDSLPLEAASFAISVAIVVAYHVYLRSRVLHDSHYTIQAINRRAREVWVENIMSDGDKDVLAVQTLRNSTMAATFLASTAILLTIGVLNLSGKGDTLGDLLSATDLGGASASLLWWLKLVPLLVDFFWAFFSFSLAVRMYNHVGYLINARGHRQHSPSPSYVARLLNRGGRYYSLGMRAYYLSVPLVFWLFGPQYLVAAAIGVVVVLYRIDRAPDLYDREHPAEGGLEQASRSASPTAGPFRLIKGR